MPENKYLWRAKIRGITRPLYLVSQNIQSAAAQATAHPLVPPDDLLQIQVLDTWDAAQNMTKVTWPDPPPEPGGEEPE